VDERRAAEVEPIASGPAVVLGAAVAIALIAGLLAAAAGPPYLNLSSLSPWIAVFAAASFAALFAVPFAANRLLVSRRPQRAEAWEGAMLVWGAVALTALGAALLLIWSGDYSPSSSLGDAIGLLLAIEAGLVVLALGAWMLAG
jgi:hypothetical protein